MAKRRILSGRPLLVATTGLMLACSGGTNVGNLMPPQSVSGEVCIDITPSDATVLVNGLPHTERCQTIETYGMFKVEASAPDYARHEATHKLTPHVNLTIELLSPLVPPRPVGNLMAPPRITPKAVSK